MLVTLLATLVTLLATLVTLLMLMLLVTLLVMLDMVLSRPGACPSGAEEPASDISDPKDRVVSV